MNRNIVVVICSIALATAGLFFYYSKAKPMKENTVQLTCPVGYSMTARYYDPDRDGILNKLTLTVARDGKKDVYEMENVISASGAKFATPRDGYYMWEHQGEFTFGKDDRPTVVCRPISLTQGS